MKRSLFLLAVLMALIPQSQAGLPRGASISTDQYAWLLNYKKTTTNGLIVDPRFSKMLDRELPHFQVTWYGASDPLPELAMKTMEGPADFIIIAASRFVTASAAVNQLANVRGLVWVDVSENANPRLVYAYMDGSDDGSKTATVDLYVKQPKPLTQLPPQLLASLLHWCREHNVRTITRFSSSDQDDHMVDLPTTLLNSR